jgi:hypothetical protein
LSVETAERRLDAVQELATFRGDDDPALGSAVQLGNGDVGDLGRLTEVPRLRESVLTSCCVDDE